MPSIHVFVAPVNVEDSAWYTSTVPKWTLFGTVMRSNARKRSVSVILLFDVLCFPPFDGPIGEFGKSAPDATQHAVVLAAVKDAARR